MTRLFSTMFACVLATSSPAAQDVTPEAVATEASAALDDAARLLPPAAHLAVRFESVAELMKLVADIARAAEAPASDIESMTPATMLSEVLSLPGDIGQIDPTRPLLVALTVSPSGPLPTFVLPVEDAAAYSASAAGMQSTAIGGYVALSPAAAPVAAEKAPVYAARLRAGMVAGYADFGTLIEDFRPIIEMGMEQAESLGAMGANADAGGMDLEAMWELYLDFAWDFLDSADELDIVLSKRGDQLVLQKNLTVKDGSPMTGFGGSGTASIERAARWLDPGASLNFAGSCDWGSTMKKLQPFMDSMFELYPDGLRETLEESMELQSALYPLFGDVLAGTGDLGPGGMRVAYYLESEDPTQVVAGIKKALAGLTEGVGMTVSEPEHIEVGDVQGLTYTVEIDLDILLADMPKDSEIAELQAKQMKAMFDTIMGPDGMNVRVMPGAEMVTMVIGGDDAFMAEALARSSAEAAAAAPNAGMQAALEALGDMQPAFLYGFDLGALMTQVGPAMGVLPGSEEAAMFEALANTELPLWTWMGIDAKQWTGGASLSHKGLLATVRQIVQARKNHESEPSGR